MKTFLLPAFAFFVLVSGIAIAAGPTPLDCPVGWYLFEDRTECVHRDGTRYVIFEGTWWKKIAETPSGVILQDPATKVYQQGITPVSFPVFAGKACRWPSAPWGVFAHAQTGQTAEASQFSCNNGSWLYQGVVAVPVPVGKARRFRGILRPQRRARANAS